MPAGKNSTCVTVVLNDEEMELLNERIEYLKEKRGTTRVSKSEAIRHAICQTNYKRDKKAKKDED